MTGKRGIIIVVSIHTLKRFRQGCCVILCLAVSCLSLTRRVAEQVAIPFGCATLPSRGSDKYLSGEAAGTIETLFSNAVPAFSRLIICSVTRNGRPYLSEAGNRIISLSARIRIAQNVKVVRFVRIVHLFLLICDANGTENRLKTNRDVKRAYKKPVHTKENDCVSSIRL